MIGRLLSLALAVLCAACASAPAALAAPGDLDETFSKDGKVSPDLPGCQNATAAAALPDGKILVSGNVNHRRPNGGCAYPGSSAVIRLLPNGRFDPSFGSEGIAGIGEGEGMGSLAVQPDGKILLGGGRKVARLNPDGTLDQSFGAGGVVREIGIPVTALAVTADGGILLGGYDQTPSRCPRTCFAVAKLTASGVPDYSFGDGDSLALAFYSGVGAQIQALAELPDGRIVAGGAFEQGYYVSKAGLLFARFGADGTLDETFSEDGLRAVDGPPLGASFGAESMDMATGSGGAILAAGQVDDGIGLTRIDARGALDQTYANAGFSRVGPFTPKEEVAWPTGVAQADASVIEGGVTARVRTDFRDNITDGHDFAVARVDAAGRPDPGFGVGDGTRAIDFYTGDDYANDVAVTADGGIVQVGYAYGGFDGASLAIAKYTTAPGRPDLDADGIRDRPDRCPEAHAKSHGGCPRLDRRLTFSYASKQSQFQGDLSSRFVKCLRDRASIMKVRKGRRDKVIFRGRADFEFDYGAPRGRFYAKVEARDLTIRGVCKAVRSRVISP